MTNSSESNQQKWQFTITVVQPLVNTPGDGQNSHLYSSSIGWTSHAQSWVLNEDSVLLSPCPQTVEIAKRAEESQQIRNKHRHVWAANWHPNTKCPARRGKVWHFNVSMFLLKNVLPRGMHNFHGTTLIMHDHGQMQNHPSWRITGKDWNCWASSTSCATLDGSHPRICVNPGLKDLWLWIWLDNHHFTLGAPAIHIPKIPKDLIHHLLPFADIVSRKPSKVLPAIGAWTMFPKPSAKPARGPSTFARTHRD